jgi:hypothetical protein
VARSLQQPPKISWRPHPQIRVVGQLRRPLPCLLAQLARIARLQSPGYPAKQVHPISGRRFLAKQVPVLRSQFLHFTLPQFPYFLPQIFVHRLSPFWSTVHERSPGAGKTPP